MLWRRCCGLGRKRCSKLIVAGSEISERTCELRHTSSVKGAMPEGGWPQLTDCTPVMQLGGGRLGQCPERSSDAALKYRVKVFWALYLEQRLHRAETWYCMT